MDGPCLINTRLIKDVLTWLLTEYLTGHTATFAGQTCRLWRKIIRDHRYKKRDRGDSFYGLTNYGLAYEIITCSGTVPQLRYLMNYWDEEGGDFERAYSLSMTWNKLEFMDALEPRIEIETFVQHRGLLFLDELSDEDLKTVLHHRFLKRRRMKR